MSDLGYRGFISPRDRGPRHNGTLPDKHEAYQKSFQQSQTLQIDANQTRGTPGSYFASSMAVANWGIFTQEQYYRHAFTNLTELAQGIRGFIHGYNTTRRY